MYITGNQGQIVYVKSINLLPFSKPNLTLIPNPNGRGAKDAKF